MCRRLVARATQLNPFVNLLDRHIIVRFLANFLLLMGLLFVFAISIAKKIFFIQLFFVSAQALHPRTVTGTRSDVRFLAVDHLHGVKCHAWAYGALIVDTSL